MHGVRHISTVYFEIMRGKIINVRAVIQVTCNFIDAIDWYRKNTGRVVIVTAGFILVSSNIRGSFKSDIEYSLMVAKKTASLKPEDKRKYNIKAFECFHN